MDVKTRLTSAEQQSHELHRTFSHLEHRIREFIELQTALGDMHQQLGTLGGDLTALRAELQVLQRLLPTIARREELARFEQKLNAVPFERFAARSRALEDSDE